MNVFTKGHKIADELEISVEEVQSAIDNRPSVSDWIWVGNWHHEGIRHKINGIDKTSKWVRRWVESPGLWMVTNVESDEDGYDSDAITKERIARLPANVRVCITPFEE